MTTQAITDIKELVGEMPARGCQCRIAGCNGEKHVRGRCDHQAKWAALVHGADNTKHGNFELDLCDRCLATARNIWEFKVCCRVCGNAQTIRALPL